ncbi:O-methyltransferase [Candidatus Dependentiae bacterium Noda2021]|nr:O-methyltransferase [Candidatus Dependentiae bacterium Noda2021]
MKKINLYFIVIIFSFVDISANALYLDLMKRCLLNLVYQDANTEGTFSQDLREQGRDCPTQAHTMIGLHGLNNIQNCLEDIIKNNIPGDCIETGVWRGGAVIFMRSILKAYNVTDRTVWVADSFEGLPVPNTEKYPEDNYPYNVSTPNKILAISLEQVRDNFTKYGLLDDQVRFLKGWFKDTLPNAPIDKIALLRLDGDFYESTMDTLINLYPKLSVGGYIIIDDYVAMTQCEKAIQDYRRMHNITDKIEEAGWSIRYWKKSK